LREHLQRGANRMMYGYRDEPYEVLAQFGRTLESTLLPGRILPTTVEAIARALKLPFAEIAIRQGGFLRPVAAWGVANRTEAFPLTYAGEHVGVLRVSPREGEAKLSRADASLLADLAQQVGIAAHALILQTDLEHSRLRVITAREEARKLLGHELHDSVGHSLAGLMRRAETASNVLQTNPQQAKHLLSDIVEQGSVSITHVRSLAHKLHPPELELLGLLGSIRERAMVEGNKLKMVLEMPDTLPKLSAAIEVAAYCILHEALHNVSKHASATTCTVQVTLSQIPIDTSVLTQLEVPVLELAINDDGTGSEQLWREASGLISMRERATEVGGTFFIGSGTGGTRVIVRLPCWEG